MVKLALKKNHYLHVLNELVVDFLIDIFPDDHTRVVLHDYEVEHDDYINANYIDVSFIMNKCSVTNNLGFSFAC